MTGAISQDRESCQFLFCLDQNPNVASVGLDGVGGWTARKVPHGGWRSRACAAWPGYWSASGEDPSVEKKVVIEGGQSVLISPGDT
jgi:hypothetical protein